MLNNISSHNHSLAVRRMYNHGSTIIVFFHTHTIPNYNSLDYFYCGVLCHFCNYNYNMTANNRSKYMYILYLAVFVLFIHAIVQQRLISSIRQEISEALESGSLRGKGQIVHGSVDYYLAAKSPPNLPSLQLSSADEANAIAIRTKLGYGGNKDGLHLGGFTEIDQMVTYHTVKYPTS